MWGIYDYVFAVIRRAKVAMLNSVYFQIQALYHVLTFRLNNEIRQCLKEANPLLLLKKKSP